MSPYPTRWLYCVEAHNTVFGSKWLRLTLLCSNFVKFGGEIMRYLPDQKSKILRAFQTVADAQIAPKICQGQPPTMYSECSRFHPNWFTFGGVIAECVNTVKLPRKVNPIFGRSLALSRTMRLPDPLARLRRQLNLTKNFLLVLWWCYRYGHR